MKQRIKFRPLSINQYNHWWVYGANTVIIMITEYARTRELCSIYTVNANFVQCWTTHHCQINSTHSPHPPWAQSCSALTEREGRKEGKGREEGRKEGRRKGRRKKRRQRQGRRKKRRVKEGKKGGRNEGRRKGGRKRKSQRGRSEGEEKQARS